MNFISNLFYRIRNLPRFVILSIIGVMLAISLLYYPIGMIIIHKVDDDLEFKASEKFDIAGGSHTVAMAQALIEREVWLKNWTPNDPFFYPSHFLIRMPAFQRGMISAISRFAVELSDQIGRSRGSSQIDPDLEKAAGMLKYSPNIWIIDPATSWLIGTSSETQYLGAMKLLGGYNERLAKNEAVFDKRADNLMEALERIGTDMGSSSAIIVSHIDDNSNKFFDSGASDIFYYIKGRMYVNYLLMRELKKDFADLIQEKQLGNAWDNTLESLKEGASLSHFFIFNASKDSQFLPNHLAIQGLYLMRARTQLKEVTNILLK